MIQNPARLSLSKGQLRLENDGGVNTLPLEDVTALILESPQITLSSALLSACQESAVALITCDATHIPNGVLLPFQPHSRQSRVAYIQQSWSEPLRKRLWQRVVQTKINNQASCLEAARGDGSGERLYALARRVASGDPDNIEAQAARDYFPRLYGAEFNRGSQSVINAALNYGYAVVRAFVARSQIAYGLIPAFGIHHANDLNAFNLTDDLMEVFRPMVDWQVVLMLQDGLGETARDGLLTKEFRQILANIGNALCAIKGDTHTIANAADAMAASLVSAIEKKDATLLILPEFVRLSYEDALR